MILMVLFTLKMSFQKMPKKFKGFSWRADEQPQSVSDLFKDDPPLILPKIKGLKKPDPLDVLMMKFLIGLTKKIIIKLILKFQIKNPNLIKTNLSKRSIQSNLLKAKNR